MGTVVLEAGKEYEITADTVLKCSYEKLKFTLTIDKSPQTVEYGYTYTIEKTKPGKKLVSVKVDGNEFTEVSFVIKKNTTVDYVWAYTVTYKGLDTVPQDVTSELQTDVICDTQFTVPYIKGYLITSIMNGSVPVKPGSTIEPTSNITLTYTVEKGSDLEYTDPVASGNVSVNKYADESSKYKGDIVIPDMNSDGKLITGIDSEAFYECNDLLSVKIPDSVTSIGGFAFSYCYKLTTITIPDNVTSIERYAFYGCPLLSEIALPKNLEFIGSSVFSHSAIKTLTIPEKVRNIEGNPIYDCKNLESITIEQGNNHFKISESNGIKYILSVDGKQLIAPLDLVPYPNPAPDAGTKDITIPEGIEVINGYAFSNRDDIRSVILPGSIKEIGKSAFGRCYSMETIDFSKSTELQIIGESAFEICISLKTLNIPNKVTRIGNTCFHQCSGLEGNIEIPTSVEIIGQMAFQGCDTTKAKLVIHQAKHDKWFNNWNGGLPVEWMDPNQK